MNASVEKWRPPAARRHRPALMAAAWVVIGGCLPGGCADIRSATTLPPVNPESPVAGAVAAAAMQNFKRPTFASVPPKPLNIPPPDAVKSAVIDMVRCRRAYETWAATHPALVSGTESYAEGLQAELDNNPADRPTPAENAATEAEVAKLRAYAEPPPPMHPGPPPSASEAAPPSVKTAAAPRPRPSPAVATTTAAAQTPASVPSAASAASAASASAPAPQAVAAVKPAMTPLYGDPLLAHCQ